MKVYRRTRNDEDYINYKEALNADTTETSYLKEAMSKNVHLTNTNDSKIFYVYVRNKQKVRDKVGPLEDCAGNII